MSDSSPSDSHSKSEREGMSGEPENPKLDPPTLPDLESVERLFRGNPAAFEARRAALNLMEDAVAARHAALRESAERLRSEKAMRESEEKYRSLFESIDEGFCIIEVLFNRAGRPMDYRFVEVNPAFERHTGIANAVGRTMRELVPAHEEHWFEVYGRVALTGEAVRFENDAASLGQHYDVYAFRVGPEPNCVAVLFHDITERKRRESNAAFLAEVSVDLVRLSTAEEITQTVGSRVAEYLGLSSCILADVDEARDEVVIQYGWTAPDVPSVKQTFRLQEYLTGEFQRASGKGEPFVVTDTAHDPRVNAENYSRLGIGAFVTIPISRNGHWTNFLSANSRAPRAWREDEISLLHEISSRLFARLEQVRAERALRESEEKFRGVTESGVVAVAFFDEEGAILDANDAFLDLVGFTREELHSGAVRWDKLTPPEWIPQTLQAVEEYKRTGRIIPYEKEYFRKDGQRFWGLFGGRRLESTNQGVAFVLDITQQKKAETSRRRNEARQSFLLKFSDVLRPLASPLEIQDVAARMLGEYLKANRVGYAEDEGDGVHAIVAPHYTNGVPSIEGRHTYASYGEQLAADLRAGRTIVRPDVARDPSISAEEKEAHAALQLGATLYVPLVKAGRLVATLFLHYRKPRTFSRSEVALVQEVADRTWAAVERAYAEKALAEDLRAMELLRELGVRPIDETDIQPLYEDINNTAMKLTHADAGTVQIFDPNTEELILLAKHGFPPDSAVRFGRVSAGSSTSCGLALKSGKRWIVDFDDPNMDDSKGDLRWHVEAGYRSAQSTPLISRTGRSIGMLSTHWRKRHRPSDRELRYIDLLARQAADLIERKTAEDALNASKERLRIVVDSALEHAIISMDLDRKIGSWNPGAVNIFGHAAMDVLGKTADIIFTPEDRENGVPEREMIKAKESGRAADNRWHLRKDGSRFWANGAMLPMRASFGGQIVGYVKILRDETEMERNRQALADSRAELEKALTETQAARMEAEAAGRAKDHFLAVLSHELRTPLTPVLMATSMLQEDETITTQVREALEMMERNILLEARLVDDLLDVTRIARGKMELSLASTDFHSAIRHAVEICQPDLQAKEHHLSISLDAQQHQLKGDHARLQQAVWNLLKNACKFTPKGGQIRIRTENQEDRIILQVQDSGIGLETGAESRVFDAFVQADEGVARLFGGLGLGLAITKATVEAHGGVISAHSGGRNQGTTFEVTLPLRH